MQPLKKKMLIGNMVILLVMFQLRAVWGHQILGPGMPTSQIEIIGVPCPVIEKSMPWPSKVLGVEWPYPISDRTTNA